MFKEINWQFVIGCSIFALVLSLISGLFGHIRFASLLFRVLVSAGGFAVIAVLLNLAALKFLPEIMEPVPDASDPMNLEASQNAETGNRVDMVLGGEGGDEPTELHSIEMEDENGGRPKKNISLDTGEPVVSDDLGNMDMDQLEDEFHQTAAIGSEEVDNGQVDTLPNEDFNSVGRSSGDESIGSPGGARSGRGKPSDGMTDNLRQQPKEDIAAAIQTVLKRDQTG